ncbi:MAG: hypothetical protein SH856_04210 [Flavobacteriales bacterium]|nr:hypothetical protein [Flavobacteriales bacterium]
MKKIIWILLALAIVGGAIGYYLWNKPHREAAGEKAVATLTADELLSQYEADETASNTKYIDKVVEVSGKVSVAETDAAGNAVVQLETSSPMGVVHCTYSPGEKSSAAGTEITLKGICSGFLSDVQLTKCSEVKPH